MAIFLILLWIASVIALFVGLVKPSLVLPRRGTPPTRKRVGIVYGVGSFVLFLWGGSAAGREQAKEEARALQADSASVQTLLARAGTLNPAEAQRVDAIIHRRHFTFAHDAVHSRVIDARLDSAATLLGQDGKHAAAKDLLATGFSEPLTVDQKAHRESLQGQTTAAIAKDEEARNRAQAEAKFADNQGLLDSAAALLQANADGWGNVTGGRAVLNQLGPLTPEQTARKNTLLAMADRQYILIEESAVRIATKLMLDQRRQFARNLETQMLDNNFNVTITTPGRNATTLRIEWILVNKVTAHQFSKQAEFFAKLKQLGFERLEITDGYDEEWSWDNI